MESTLSNAFLLLGIGMITVFLVLFLVVVVGSGLIKIINRFSSEPITKKLVVPAISNNKVATMTAVVEHITQGKGKIDSIEKIV